jgi:hypothetical protein
MTWIKIKDKLPDKDGPCLFFAPSADPDQPLISRCWFTPGQGFSLVPVCFLDSITHWMPLPDWPEDYKKEVYDAAA